MKWLFLAFLGLFIAPQAVAQFGNEWIRANQQYYKISVAKDGLYKLTYADLQQAGFPVNTINPIQLQLFHRGVEQRITVAGELDGVFDPADFIEFYGLRNTGTGDAPLYQPASAQPHPYYNLYSDTTAYFLTVNTLVQPGLRMEPFSEVNVGGLPAETFHVDEKLNVLATQYSTGRTYLTYVQYSYFDVGEGWTGNQIANGGFVDYTLDNILHPATASGNPTFEIQLVGRANVAHQVQLSVGPTAPSRVVATQTFFGFDVVTITSTLNWTDIGADGKLMIRVSALGVSGAADRLSASYIKVNYPQIFNAASATEKVFTLTPRPGNKSFVSIQNAAPNTRLFDVTDPTNVVPIGTTQTATLNAVIENTITSRKILATALPATPNIKRIHFKPLNTAAEYIIISHKALMKPAAQYSNAVKAYSDYRASTAGGGYDTLVADIEQLYNQFNYGEVSPLAIRRFMFYLLNSGDPKYLFLIGKGLDVVYGYHRDPTSVAFSVLKDLVPSAGMPGSDILFTAGLRGNGYEPALPTGRITASTPQDVAAYLNKVIEKEAKPFDALWQKELLHLSGGIYDTEPERFKQYLQQFGNIASTDYLGGNVSAIAKGSRELEFVNISEKLNAGLNLITLFGHSSPSQNDFNIGFVSAPEWGYNNVGKYPMLLINGCNAGEFFATTTRYGEDWINAPVKGAVGFLANTSFGFEGNLYGYSDLFYKIAYGDSSYIYKGIGDVQKEIIRQYTNFSTSIQYVTQAQQMMLLGDPAVPLFGAKKPDYEINNSQVYAESYTVEPITALSDSFALKIVVRNFGRTKEDTFKIEVKRTLSDNTIITYDSAFLPVLYRDTLTFNIPRDAKGFGNNTFEVTVDYLNDVAELNEENNSATYNFFIPLNAARSLYPQGFAIVNTLTTNLIAQSTNLMDAARDFIIQVDTTDTFNSAYLREFAINGKLATQSIDLLADADTLAYYWRVKFAQPSANESAEWAITSFTYIKDGNAGWAQVHFPQYMSNEVAGLVKDTEGRQLTLQETITDVSIHTFGSANPTPYTQVSVRLNQSEYNTQSLPEVLCRNNTLNLLAFDRTTTMPYMPVNVQYPDKRACGRRPEVITSFLTTEFQAADGKNLIAYIDNVQAGDSVILFSIGNAGYAAWPVDVVTKLGELGISSTQLSVLQAGEPVVIFGRKGSAAGSARIERTLLSPANAQELQVTKTITGRFVSGEMKSAIIGPATVWQKFSTKTVGADFPQTDEVSFDLIGISLSGVHTPIEINYTGVTLDLSNVDADVYPYLQLVFHATDEINLTAPQLKNWIVEYTPAPEGVLTFTGPEEQRELAQGEPWSGSYKFTNISQKAFSDSLTVQYSLYNTTSRATISKSKKVMAPLPGAEVEIDVAFETDESPGLNDVSLFVNPRILPELYYDNNALVLSQYLNVQGDNFNPVLEVTIDGRFVTNGDYVSNNPMIVAKLWDENPILLKTDTTGIIINLKYPCVAEECPFKRIYINRSDVMWFPATATTDFRIEFAPQDLPEGTYTLQVDARDNRNNASGKDPYEITFVVVADQSIVIERPYPNPSYGNVMFKVIVTGEIRPEDMKLEIINGSGQLIANFSKRDFYTGTNQIVWQSGELPAGMYFYRMILTSENGRVLKTAQGKVLLKP
jgi:hypothetical protein